MNDQIKEKKTYKTELLQSVNQKILVVECPHCQEFVTILENELNCKIFRHGVYIHNMQPINPHSSKEECENLKKNNLIYGCSKPFQIIELNDDKDKDNIKSYKVEICDYI